MTAHDHREYVYGCFRCDLSRCESSIIVGPAVPVDGPVVASDFDPPELRSLNPARAERSAQRLRVIEEVVDYARLHPELAEFDSDEPVVPPGTRMRAAIEQAIARGLAPSRVMAETGCDYATYRAVLDVPRRGG